MDTTKFYYIVNYSNMQVYNLAYTPEEAEAERIKAKEASIKDAKTWANHYEKYGCPLYDTYRKQAEEARYKVMTEEEYNNELRAYYLANPLKEVSEEVFEEMLNILPPINWYVVDGIEMFCISEMLTGSYTNQYAKDKRTGKCYTKIVDCTNSSTWINNFLEK